jgi:Ca2+-binding RTX toxin-like protein
LTLAPSSNPNDDPSVLSLYAADYGVPHVNDGRLFEISNPFFYNHAAPVISTNNLTTTQNADGSITFSGVQVGDSDLVASSEAFSVAATTEAAASGTSVTPSMTSGLLADINNAFATGLTYDPGVTPPPTDMVTLVVKDNFGAADTENLVFAPAGPEPNLTLQGTAAKDVILATNSQDTLTGGAAADQFVFAPTSAGPPVQHTITDFVTGVDKIDVRQFSNLSTSVLPIETQQGNDTMVTLDSHDTLLLISVTATNLQATDFMFHA